MLGTARLDILHHFAAVADPHNVRFVTHPLGDLLTFALVADSVRGQKLRGHGYLRPGQGIPGCAPWD